jgi:hypothetical protein
MNRRGFASHPASCAYLHSRRMIGSTCSMGSHLRMPPLASNGLRPTKKHHVLFLCMNGNACTPSYREWELEKCSILKSFHIERVGVGVCDSFENFTTWHTRDLHAILWQPFSCLKNPYSFYPGLECSSEREIGKTYYDVTKFVSLYAAC